MSAATGELRIYIDKEMFSADMAEIVDASYPRSGVIQGCGIRIENGVLSIESGRLIIRGRLAVVTGGNIALPAISAEQTCWLLAVCDLNNSQNPFYFTVVDSNGLSTLEQARTTGSDFNLVNGLDYITLGSLTVDPVRDLASNWTPEDSSIAKKGPDIYADTTNKITETRNLIQDYMVRKSFNTGAHSAASGTGTISYTYTIPDAEIPTGYKPFDVRCATNGGGDGWWEFYNCSCDFTDYPTNKNVALKFQRRSGTGGTLYSWIVVTFVKDIT